MEFFPIDIPAIFEYNNKTINHSIGGDSLQYVAIESKPMIIVLLKKGDY